MNSKTPPRVSIALPVRDAGPWLAECLDSVLAQTERNFELIAVDDGSRDSSLAILKSYAARDPRLRILGTGSRGGDIAAALNLALEAARAPLLVRMDADDRMHPERLARQAAALDADRSLFAVASRAAAFPAEQLRDGMRDYLEWQNGLLTAEDIARDRFVESPVLHPTVAMRTGALRGILGGWSRAAWPEDWDLFLRAFEHGFRIARLPEVLLEWRLHPAQLTRTHARYSEQALLDLRATYLARHLARAVQAGRPLWILGAGPVGKGLVKALAAGGVVAAGLADVDPRKIGGVVRGAAHRWAVVDHARLQAMTPRPFAVSAVAGAEARVRVRSLLSAWSWKEGEDYVVAA